MNLLSGRYFQSECRQWANWYKHAIEHQYRTSSSYSFNPAEADSWYLALAWIFYERNRVGRWPSWSHPVSHCSRKFVQISVHRHRTSRDVLVSLALLYASSLWLALADMKVFIILSNSNSILRWSARSDGGLWSQWSVQISVSGQLQCSLH